MKRELERIDIPGEHEARVRTWAVLVEAFAERAPSERRRPMLKPALALAAVLAAIAAVASPSGRAVLDELREVVGVERAQPALFSLPSAGRLLVASDAGVWVVHEDGSKRLLGDYREASWSPFGRFIVAARANELAALEPDGDVRWTLARPGVRSPRWTGTETDTRIAYVDRTGLRVVAGDGTGDRLLAPGARGPLAWKPGAGLVLAYVDRGTVAVRSVISGDVLWRIPARRAERLEWSADGRRLLVASLRSLRVYDADGRHPLVYELGPGAARIVAGALAPSGQSLVFAQEAAQRSQVWVVPRIRPDASAARRLFGGTGTFGELAWTSDGRWILVTWPNADQWVFVRADGGRVRAISGITQQFRSGAFPRVAGWCCAPTS